MPLAPDLTGDTFKKSIKILKRITLVNPCIRLKSFARYYQFSFLCKQPKQEEGSSFLKLMIISVWNQQFLS